MSQSQFNNDNRKSLSMGPQSHSNMIIPQNTNNVQINIAGSPVPVKSNSSFTTNSSNSKIDIHHNNNTQQSQNQRPIPQNHQRYRSAGQIPPYSFCKKI